MDDEKESLARMNDVTEYDAVVTVKPDAGLCVGGMVYVNDVLYRVMRSLDLYDGLIQYGLQLESKEDAIYTPGATLQPDSSASSSSE